MKINIALSRSKEIRTCRNYNDDLGCMSGCKTHKVFRQSACKFEDGKNYEPNSKIKYQQDCKCWH